MQSSELLHSYGRGPRIGEGSRVPVRRDNATKDDPTRQAYCERTRQV